MIVDTSVILAFMNGSDPDHETVAELFDGSRPRVTTPLVLAETDHLLSRYAGHEAAAAFRADLLAGAYEIEWWAGALAATVATAERHAGIGLGLTDASLVALADELGETEIATLDQRHFRAVAPAGAPAFRVLPADR